MIQLRSDCLVFENPDGTAIPVGAEEIAIKLVGQPLLPADAEVLRHAAIAVLHYFKFELKRETITLGEFSQALEQALRAFGLQLRSGAAPSSAPPRIVDTDLRRLACASGHGCELVFFPMLRDELHRRLEEAQIVRFNGLRGCVKQLLGAQRWTSACQELSDQIVEFLRASFGLARRDRCALVVQ